MLKYRSILPLSKGTPISIKQVELKQPGPKRVLIKVLACGVCHTDSFEQHGFLGDVFPRVPGHELIGDIVAVGEGVTRLSIGDRVGGPWHGEHDGTCRQCMRSQFQICDVKKVNGVSHDGGYAEYVLLQEEGHAQDGVGGLGHLAIQYANKMGCHVVAISSGGSKRDFAKQLGAHADIDTRKEDAIAKLKEIGGAALIVATAPNPKAISPLVGGLQAGGKLLVLAPVGPVEFDTGALVSLGLSIHGWPSGHALDWEEAIKFAQEHGVKCMVETFSLDDAQKALDHCTSGNLRFRAVLLM
ncbi:alcohol dehydrogenase GroES-like domain-containing protein [Pseudomassariella vexata]|uniref:Alcohol dehydrogenase GroES-like domain-containing protein n=1 Tax=Pseudomassariella vexata TaxID=1141098 RepID=A0A1Y2D9T2_9PEZI|nr:alcohol dehydrogenase GroES-like domain-containing protein [Pseudomassariella vexata]ORY55934.1 alcohol dehydrogenase GroES-like domain-containing protein [Pseudomassariella vexata]